MKKNFLIILLMTLLPLAAWADEPLTVTLKASIIEYQGDVITPPIKSVKVGTTTLTSTDYTLSYKIKNNNDSYEDIEEIYGVGKYKVLVTGTGTYAGKSDEADLEVGKATLTVTPANCSKTYGENDPAPTYSVTGFKGYDSKYNTTINGLTIYRVNTSKNVGTYTYSINTAGATVSGGNYDVISTGSANLIINKKAMSITAEAKSKTYGDADPALTYTYDGLVSGDSFTGVLERVEGENVVAGGYDINQGSLEVLDGNDGDNYDITYTGAKLTINQKAATITAIAQTVTYGTAISQGTSYVTPSGLLTDHIVSAVTLTPSTDAVTTTGTITPSAIAIQDGSGNNVTANYNITAATGTLTIDKLAVTITANAQTVTYGTDISQDVAKVTPTGLLPGHIVRSVDLSQSTNDVTTTGTITPSNIVIYDGSNKDVTANYSITPATGVLTITQKAATITANAQTVTYGTAISQDVAKVTPAGLLAGHSMKSVTLTQSTENVTTDGTITLSAFVIQDGGGYDVTANYNITPATGTLTITQKAATITANAQTITYGTDISQGTSYVTPSGLLSGHVVSAVTLTPSTGAATTTGTITPSDIAIQDGSGNDVTANYNITPATGTLTIGQLAVTITANAQTVTYGTAISQGATYVTPSGLLTGHIVSAVTLTQSTVNVTTDGTATITPSAIKITDGTNDVTDNYTITPATGVLTINQKAITITAVDQTVNYGTAITGGGAMVESGGNFLTGHYVKSVTLTPSTTNATTNGTITPSDIVIWDGGDINVTANYNITPATGKLVINPVEITLKAKDQTVNYPNTANTTVSTTTVEITSGELKNGDLITGIGIALECAATSIGTHTGAIIINKASASQNYIITPVPGTLTINNAATILELTGADTDFQLIKDYNGQTLPVTINLAERNGRNLGGERNWVKENWVTLTLPFNITVAQLSQKLGYALVNVIDPTQTVIDGTGSKFYGKLTMKGGYGENYLPANKPLLVKIADDIAYTGTDGVIDFGTQTIVAPATEADLTVDAGQGAKFIGSYTSKTVTSADDENIWFMIGGGYTQWAYIASTSANTWTIKPFEAFIDMSGAPYSAPNMTFYFEEIDGSTTAIRSVDADNMNRKLNAEGWYTLNGVKLQNAPTEKGIYIKDGKKVVIK